MSAINVDPADWKSIALFHAIQCGDIGRVEDYLQDSSVNINYIIYDHTVGNTPLLIAVKNENVEMVELLLDAGAIVNQKLGNGDTPILLACERGNTEIVQMLLDAGACVNWRNRDDETLLMMVSKSGNGEILKMLLDAGADVYLKDREGETALDHATGGMYTDVKFLLVEAIKRNPQTSQ